MHVSGSSAVEAHRGVVPRPEWHRIVQTSCKLRPPPERRRSSPSTQQPPIPFDQPAGRPRCRRDTASTDRMQLCLPAIAGKFSPAARGVVRGHSCCEVPGDTPADQPDQPLCRSWNVQGFAVKSRRRIGGSSFAHCNRSSLLPSPAPTCYPDVLSILSFPAHHSSSSPSVALVCSCSFSGLIRSWIRPLHGSASRARCSLVG
jgi:hypothetical protein